MDIKKRQKIYRDIMLIIVVALITFVLTIILSYNGSIRYVVSENVNNSVTKKIDTLLATITELLDEKYIGEVEEEKLVDGALKGLVDSLGDEYTVYYSKEELEDFTTQTIGNFVGIGVYMKANTEKDVAEVILPIEGSPAEEVGLKTGDEILKADGNEYKAKDLSKLANYIKGEEGTTVVLTIKRGEEIFDVTVERRSVHLKYVEGKMLEDSIGYIRIAAFDEGSSIDFEKEYDKLAEQGLKSLIIDIRENGGGIVTECLNIADLMCEKDEITLIKVDKDGKEEVTRSKTDPKIKMPIVVLTDEGSASASEILTAALKDNNKATIVGEKTFGKGVIQELICLSNGGALKVTSSEYYTPNKEKIHGIGISPDIEIEFDLTNLKVDEQLNKAIEVIKEKMK